MLNFLLAYDVSDAESTEIVNFHNYIRQLISEGRVPNQPRGTNLKTLVKLLN